MTLVISGVNVFDGDEMRPTEHSVYVSEGRIADSPSPDAPIRDFSSRPAATVLPGLIDSHIHLAISGADQSEKSDPASLVALRMAHNALINLRCGVTTVRDLGAKDRVDVSFKRGIGLGLVQGPRYLICGQPVIATGGHTPYMGVEVDGPFEARRATRRQLKVGVDWVKMMVTGGIMTQGTDPRRQQLFKDEIEAVVETAHAAGTPVAAHCQGGPGIVDAISAGIDSLEHGIWLDDRAIDLMLENDTAYVPTLSAIYLISQGQEVAGVRPPPWSIEKARAATDTHQASFRRAVDAGVRIVAGTDYKQGSLAYELELMSSWGMGPLEALRSATSRAADLLEIQDIGRIQTGKHADLVVVDGDPLSDISALQRVLYVVQGGKEVFNATERGSQALRLEVQT